MTQRFTIERPQNQQVFKGGADPWRRNDKPRNKPRTEIDATHQCTNGHDLCSWETDEDCELC